MINPLKVALEGVSKVLDVAHIDCIASTLFKGGKYMVDNATITGKVNKDGEVEVKILFHKEI